MVRRVHGDGVDGDSEATVAAGGQRDEASVFETVKRLYADRYGVKVERGLGFEDTFAMVVRGADAERLG